MANRPLTPTISQVQEELAKFLQDFDTVKFLINDSDEQPDTTTSDSRRSLYDNVPSTQESVASSDSHPSVPRVEVTKPTPEKDKPKPLEPLTFIHTFPRVQKDVPDNALHFHDDTDELFPRGHSSQSTKPTIRCSTCKEVLQSKNNIVYYPTYCTLGRNNNKHRSSETSSELPSLEDGTWKSNHPTHVRFKLNESLDKIPLRWGGNRVTPVRENEKKRKKPCCPPSFIVAVVLAAIGVCLLGIGVAVTCATLLSVLQDDVKEATTGCQIQTHHAHLVISWLYNNSCNSQFNKSLADVSGSNFVKAAKVYEAFLDPVFRRGENKDYFDFTKVEKVWCLSDSDKDVFISFKIFWKDSEHVPEPRYVLQDFLMSIAKSEQERYNISTYSVTIDGYQLGKH